MTDQAARCGGHRGVNDLVRSGYTQVSGIGEVPAAAACPLREQRHRFVRVLAPGQVRAGAPGCLPWRLFLLLRDLRGRGAEINPPRRASSARLGRPYRARSLQFRALITVAAGARGRLRVRGQDIVHL